MPGRHRRVTCPECGKDCATRSPDLGGAGVQTYPHKPPKGTRAGVQARTGLCRGSFDVLQASATRPV